MKTYSESRHQTSYSILNPPSSVEDAIHRRDEVSGIVEKIESDLKSRSSADFDNVDAYGSWKARAATSRLLFQKEISFLKRWIARDELPRKVADFLATAEPYVPLYSAENPPPSLALCDERRQEIRHHKIRHERFLSALKREAAQSGCLHQDIQAANGEVVAVIDAIQKEAAFLKLARASLTDDGSAPPPPPLPPQGHRLRDVRREMGRLNRELGLKGGMIDVTQWLFDLVQSSKERLTLDTDQERRLALIKEYIPLAIERVKLMNPGFGSR